MKNFDNHELSYKIYLQTSHAENCKFELIDSSGHDVLLKYVRLEISKPFNQMITTGIFPDSLKIAKIISICKK